MTEQDRRSIVEDELFLLRDSGELPEIAYHSSLYYLTEDQDGPCLFLSEGEQRLLQEAALERCQQIVLRDLLPDNRDLGIYRGPQRSIYNWQRYCRFCQRVDQRQDDAFKERVAQALVRFIRQEVADVEEGCRESSVNCTTEDLLAFAEEVGVSSSNPDLGRLFLR
ncbi:hypothetical protein VU11_00920 [Desulfobulbus sp. US2]|nr:hypothetical protein [Desulfobulbus sp. US4]MCW5207245.1 hypothetical protein [Desulfobulbus sp. US2]MCW5210275.1 hypothetical protein [Desulfobulbus sp. N3]